MTEEDDKSKVFKEAAEKTAVTIEAERISKLTFKKESYFVESWHHSKITYKMGKRFGLL
jgi:hypothetical protein